MTETRFMTFLSLAKPMTMTAGAIEMALNAGPDGGRSGIGSLKGPQFTQESQNAESDSCILTANGISIVVMFIAAPLPRDIWEWPAKLAVFLPEAASTMVSGRGHAVVSSLRPVAGHEQVLKVARAITLVADAIARFLPCQAVLFKDGECLTSISSLAIGAQQVAEGEVAVDCWSALQFRPGASAGEISALTYGLTPFIGRECELEPVAMEYEGVAERMWGLCGYLIENGPVIKDGDTLGLNEHERIAAKWIDCGLRDEPVIKLTIEQVDLN